MTASPFTAEDLDPARAAGFNARAVRVTVRIH